VRVAADLARHRAVLEQFQARTSELSSLIPAMASASSMTFDELASALGELRADQSTLTRLPELHRLREALRQRGLSDFLEDCAQADRSPDEAVAAITYCRAASVLEQIGFSDKRIGAFDALRHQKAVDEYRAADVDHIESAAARLARRTAEEIIRARDDWPDESALLEKQAALKRRHLPLRDLFQAAPNVLLSLKPCWAMSPLMVSQVLPSDQPYFDVVVFDEASQVVPADATPAILRGRQLVVAGDEKQLPPTAFFAAHTRDEEDTDPDHLLAGTAGFESILDALAAYLPPRTLEWHYRSQDERLIAFSNVHLYDRTLTTFPGVGGEEETVRHELVPHDPTATGDTSLGEVQRVVDLMLEHAAKRPQESLGVIAMGIKHADRIEETLRRALLEHPELDAFFSDAGPERPFVKNLERVQGDERDAIILTIGYGKGPDGRMLYRFGPLNQEGGERRLNVAVTRARKRLTLVSSFSSADMDPDRTKARGVDLLRLYIAYAESFGRNLGRVAGEAPAMNAFESDVRTALAREGIVMDPQVGCSGYRIDFAARHPTQPGRHILAIECDGASYHSSATARDRDRLRQDHLERLGWRFHRIWSQEWFHHRDRALAKAVDAFRSAVEVADREDAERETQQANGSRSSEPPTPQPVLAKPSAAPLRGPLPLRVRPGQSITDYSSHELVSLVRWINSDTLLRTEDELIQEAMRVLGLRRKGSRITTRLREAIDRSRR
jgi:very-short-patch-repair endonuclease